MKKRITVIICAALIFGLAITLIMLDSAKYVCINSANVDESKFEEIESFTSKSPFIDINKRDKLLNKAVKRAAPSFRQPFTIEITDWDLVMYEGKETLWYVISASDADGFTTMFSVIIQERWG